MLSLLLTLLSPAPALPAAPTVLVDHRDDKEWKHREKEEKRWHKEREKEEREYWKHERKWEKHRFHEEREHDREWDFDHPRHGHPCPRWMNGWWSGPAPRRYVALVPGDPTRAYVLVDGRWLLRPISDPRFRADINGAFALPPAPPPVPLPRLGLNLHVVLFD